jgi:hypothetical protein
VQPPATYTVHPTQLETTGGQYDPTHKSQLQPVNRCHTIEARGYQCLRVSQNCSLFHLRVHHCRGTNTLVAVVEVVANSREGQRWLHFEFSSYYAPIFFYSFTFDPLISRSSFHSRPHFHLRSLRPQSLPFHSPHSPSHP